MSLVRSPGRPAWACDLISRGPCPRRPVLAARRFKVRASRHLAEAAEAPVDPHGDDVLAMLDRVFTSDISGTPSMPIAASPSRSSWPNPTRTWRLTWRAGCSLPAAPWNWAAGPAATRSTLASFGFTVDAVDQSPRPWPGPGSAPRRPAPRSGSTGPISLGLTGPLAPTTWFYDSGCLHHLAPHRRVSYRALLVRMLAPGGHFGLVCFASGAKGSELPDEEFHRQGQLFGDVAYSPDELRWIFSDLTEVEMRPMAEQSPDSPRLGVPLPADRIVPPPRSPLI